MTLHGRWSVKFTECQGCGTTENKHWVKGLCHSCFNKQPETIAYCREQQRLWRKNNPEKFQTILRKEALKKAEKRLEKLKQKYPELFVAQPTL